MTSERLGFRTWTISDMPLAKELWGDPRVTQFIDARGRLSEVQVEERLAREISCLEAYGIQYWPIFLLNDAAFVGCCGLRPHKMEARIYEIGVHIIPENWRRGYAREACLAVMSFAFGNLMVGALFAGHNPKNDISRNLLLKLGFRYTHDEYYPATGLNHPSYLLTAEDFVQR
jgi:RimJ/RimL family protein N-acetyltransferase